MAKMKIQISKDDFEQSILAATSSHSEVFESVEPHFKESYLRLSQQILGEVGEAALETSDDLREAVIKAVCLDAFLGVVRHLDLVLTPTGFGVVANNEVSPASSSRVEALIEQCRIALIVAQDAVMSHLTVVSGWGSTLQAQQGIQTVVWSMEGYCYLTRQTSMTSKDWMSKLAAMQEAGVPFEDKRFIETRFSLKGAYDTTRAFFATQSDTTAVFCMSDTVAMGVIRALTDMGRRVPEDVGVIGFDGIEMSKFFVPRITTIEQPIDEIARESVRVLMDMLENGRPPRHIVVPAKVQMRESV